MQGGTEAPFRLGGGTVRRSSAVTQAAASARLLDDAFISLRSATASRDWVGADASMRNTCTVSVMVCAWPLSCMAEAAFSSTNSAFCCVMVSSCATAALPDHVHMMLSIPPKYSVSQVVGFIKGKSAIHLARVYAERKRNFVGQHFWARGYFVSTVGRDEAVIREYIRNQEKEDDRLDQLGLWR